MFVKSIKTGAVLGSALFLAASSALASDGAATLHVTLEGVKASEGKLYISVQSEADFMEERGAAGGIYEMSAAGDKSYSYNVPAGEYAVSIWHDTDNDGKFSMDANWIPTDGWGSSGTTDISKQPSFDDLKVVIDSQGAAVTIPMIYAE